MQPRREGIKRERISVSLDPVDYEYVQSISGGSDSHRLARLVRAARLAGLNVDDQSGILDQFAEFLAGKKTQPARELHKLLSEFLENR